MSSQGISGPPYSFIHGNAREVSSMGMKTMSRPMDTSHHIFPRILPHIDSWLQIHGNNFLYWHGTQAEVVITEPELPREIMSERDISLGKADMPPIFKKVVGGGLVSSEGDK